MPDHIIQMMLRLVTPNGVMDEDLIKDLEGVVQWAITNCQGRPDRDINRLLRTASILENRSYYREG